jgi:cell division septal protein FtsQ
MAGGVGDPVSTGSWIRSDNRATTLPRLLPRRLKSGQTFALVLLLVLLGWVGWSWYSSSSFVKIKHVAISGLSGPDVPQIRSALTSTALTMSTLNVNMGKLDASVSQYPEVRSLNVTTQGSHAVLIRVNEQVPVALIVAGGQALTVDGYGQVLSQSTVPHGVLPTLTVAPRPLGANVTDAGTLAVLSVLQAAPNQLLSHVLSAKSNSAHGVIVQLRSGPQVYFGPATQLAAKWEALVAVLQNSDSAGAAYIDVSDPQRPAAGVPVNTNNTSTSGNSSTTVSPWTDTVTGNGD